MALQLFSIICITAVLVGVTVEGLGGLVPGGTTEEKEPIPEVQAIINTVKPEVENELGRDLDTFTLLSYKTQVVAGVNYFAKVDIGEDDVAHLRVYQNVNQSLSLDKMLYPKPREHPINYF